MTKHVACDDAEIWDGERIGLTPGRKYHATHTHPDVQRGPQYWVVHWVRDDGLQVTLFYAIEVKQKYLAYPPMGGDDMECEMPHLRHIAGRAV